MPGSQGGGDIKASPAGCCHYCPGPPDVQGCVCHPFQMVRKTCCASMFNTRR